MHNFVRTHQKCTPSFMYFTVCKVYLEKTKVAKQCITKQGTVLGHII